MRVLHKAASNPAKLGILAGTFNPPTRAHVALAESALQVVDEVMFALPGYLPHKQVFGATLEERASMVERLARGHSKLSAGVAAGGLMADIAREAKHYYPGAEIHLICGRDAAERVLTWNYEDPEFVHRMLSEFFLLVAPRDGSYDPPEQWKHAINILALSHYEDCSATRVRDSLQSGDQTWHQLVPPEIVEDVYRIYGR